MGFLNKDYLETILRPLKNKLDNCVTKDNAEFNENITIDYYGNKAKISNNNSYVRVNIGDSNFDFTNSGELLVNNKSIFEKDNSLKLGKIVNNSGQIIEKYEVNTHIPYIFDCGSAVAIGTDIYLLGGISSSQKTNYKYDTTANTYTQMTNIPYGFYGGSAAAIGTNIYLLGGKNSDYNYKYDTTTNTYTKLLNIPYEFYSGSAVSVGTDIYLLGNLIINMILNIILIHIIEIYHIYLNMDQQ